MSLLKSRKDKELERLWYQKLAKEEFKDIEDTARGDRPLRQWHSFIFPAKDKALREAITKYYEAAAELLQTRKFESQEYRRIWQLHCEGFTYKEIQVEFKKKGKSRGLGGIQWVIEKIRKEIF